jgi:dephospho-CoA kinase
VLLVALTGNIASGKSEVARLLAHRGATIIDADVLAREAVEPGTPAHAEITARWGRGVLHADGRLNRSALRAIVFASDRERDALNAIVHPRVAELRDARIAAAREAGARVVVCDIPLLYETGGADRFDAVIVVHAGADRRRARLLAHRALSPVDADRMIAAQLSTEITRHRADYVIENEGTLAELAAEVDGLWDALVQRAKAAGAIS